MMTNKRAFYFVTLFATLLVLIVMMLGAYTRLKDAGLSCPDWPGCYGQLTVPRSHFALIRAEKLFPQSPVQTDKAWLEMTHRYFAGALGLLITILLIWSLLRRRTHADQPIWIPVLLFFIVIFQAALGMWTVTWKLYPPVVMGHLLGGMTIAALLWGLALMTKPRPNVWQQPAHSLRPWALLGLIIVIGQIFLGGWTSANYAALACGNQFPACYGTLFPKMHFSAAFDLFPPLGRNYDGGFMSIAARATLQMMHRYGGLVTLLYVGSLSLYLIFNRTITRFRVLGLMTLIVLLLQITLGIVNVTTFLSISNAVAHNGVATLLLLCIVTLVYHAYRKGAS